MALDTTVGGAGAERYLSVAEADTRNSYSLSEFAAAWSAATTARKENALRTATRDINARIRSTLPWSTAQALLFPRSTDIDVLSVPFILPDIKQATYEQAIYRLANQKLLDEAAERRSHGMIAYNNPDGTGGTLSVDPLFGGFSAEATRLLSGIPLTGIGTVRSVPMRSVAYVTPGTELLP